MNNELIEKINKCAESLFNDNRFSLLNNPENIWDELNNLFIEWQNKIKEAHKNKFVTDHVENKFKEFAKECTH